jgi:hypothetical protein
VKQSTQLICETDEAIVIDVDPLCEFSQQLVGGTIYMSTPTRTNYHIPRCRMTEGRSP